MRIVRTWEAIIDEFFPRYVLEKALTKDAMGQLVWERFPLTGLPTVFFNDILGLKT